ncbi:SymE family type I addiction module toxin [Pectobacterium brasiliense]
MCIRSRGEQVKGAVALAPPKSGFMTGMPITVTVERGRIVIETEINL